MTVWSVRHVARKGHCTLARPKAWGNAKNWHQESRALGINSKPGPPEKGATFRRLQLSFVHIRPLKSNSAVSTLRAFTVEQEKCLMYLPCRYKNYFLYVRQSTCLFLIKQRNSEDCRLWFQKAEIILKSICLETFRFETVLHKLILFGCTEPTPWSCSLLSSSLLACKQNKHCLYHVLSVLNSYCIWSSDKRRLLKKNGQQFSLSS